MPVRAPVAGRRRRKLGLEALRPWDLAVDPPTGRRCGPSRKWKTWWRARRKSSTDWIRSWRRDFRLMRELRLLDLENRKGKAPGGYQSTLAESRLPFIFMNAVGMQRDVETILHEAGHAFHALAAREEELHAYRSAPIEFCEVASMSMELLGNEFLEEFYSAPDARARAARTPGGHRGHFPLDRDGGRLSALDLLASRPRRAERRRAWLELMDRFGGDVDWSGHEEARANLWHRQLHIFLHPFYYMEYGIAQLGALQVWANSRQDPAGRLERIPARAGPGRLASAARIVCGGGLPFRFHPPHRPAAGTDGPNRTGRPGGLSAWQNSTFPAARSCRSALKFRAPQRPRPAEDAKVFVLRLED